MASDVSLDNLARFRLVFVHIAFHDVGWAHSQLYVVVVNIHFERAAESGLTFHRQSFARLSAGHVFFGNVLSLRHH